MGLTFLLTIIMMVLLWLTIWSATVTLPHKGLIVGDKSPLAAEYELVKDEDGLLISVKKGITE